MSTIIVTLEIDDEGKLVLIHPQGIRVDLPESVEINGRNTLAW